MGNEVSTNIHEKYVIREKRLGKGTYGTVHKGVRKSDKLRVAVKVLKKKRILQKPSLVEKLQREVLIMQQCDHENVVQFIDVFLSNTFVFIVIEYCAGGDLLEYLNERGRPIRTKMAKKYMRQALTGLQYLHGKGIAHRDIKPENLLLTADRQTIKLADFGLSHQTNEDVKQFETMCGSLTHIAPEVFLGKGYDHRVDIWALGVVLFVMLSVSYPFQHENRNTLIEMIMKANIDFDSDPIWENASMDAKDLILLMLNTDRDQRITLEQCLAHNFVGGESKKPAQTQVAKFKTFASSKRLASSRQMALMVEADPNEKELEEINLSPIDLDEEREDKEKYDEEITRAKSKEGYLPEDIDTKEEEVAGR